MSDQTFFQAVSDRSPFRQGDVIKRDASDGRSEVEWGVIITADCDIAQDKMGEYFTYLVIRTARNYVSDLWASEELSKLRERYGRLAIEQINLVDRLRDPDAIPLSQLELLEWACADGADAILDTLAINQQGLRKKLKTAIEIFLLANDRVDTNSTALERLIRCWRHNGKKELEQKGAIQNALRQRQMRSEYMLTPTLPSETEVGFVIMLRDIRAIRSVELFPSRLDFKIGNGSASAMYRIGRFSDFIRYAIAQRMANLFTRIGMTEQFENECEIAANLALETLLPITISVEG